MQDPAFLNPFANPILASTLARTAWVFGVGFLLVLVLHRFSFTGLWESEVGKRYLAWLVIGPLYLLAVFTGGYPSLAFLLVVMLLGIREVVRLAALPSAYALALAALAVLSVGVVSENPAAVYTLPVGAFLLLTLIAVRRDDAQRGLADLTLSVFTYLWIVFSLLHFALLGHLNNGLDASLGLENSKSLLILLGFAIPLSDVLAYVVGKLFAKVGLGEKARIAPNLSPRKTWFGTIGNVLGAGIGIAICWFAIGAYLAWWHWVVIAVLIGVMGVIGDITESLVKRTYGAKDSGDLIPGHGGVLDRIDSSLRVIVVIYYYLLLVL